MEKRIIALDNLRVLIALFVAIFHVIFFLYLFHSAQLGFIAYSFEQVFFSKMPQGIYSIAFFSVTYVPFFMNTFYLLSGFFANAACQEKSGRHFAKNRLVRIGIPLLFYFLCMAVYYLFAYLLPVVVSQKKAFLTVVSEQYYHGPLWTYFNNTSTYWFLDLLLWYGFFTLAFIGIRQLNMIPQKFFTGASKIITLLFLSRWACICVPAFIVSLLLWGNHWYLVLDAHIIPSFHILLFYGLWYFMGWNIYNHQETLVDIQYYAVLMLLLSILLYFTHAFLYIHFIDKHDFFAYLVSSALFASSLVLSVFGWIGFFLRYCSIKRSWLHYLSAGSYWMYLIQIPIIYIVSAACIVYLKSFLVQFLVCISIFAVIYFLTFHFLVRRTWLRKVLG
ncbi:MAG: acyltransferase family protein [Coxiellaceae bacterium]|nr:acyltransferase family protein [Coxiellaceae bacterium]